MNIFVSNLGFGIEDEHLRELFTPYGEVTSAKVISDKFTGQSRGFGFVEMPDDAAARKAIQELDQATVEDRAIKVAEARPREERPARGNSSFRSNDRGRGNDRGHSNDRSGGYKKNRW